MFRRFLTAWRLTRGFPYNKDWTVEWTDSDRQWLLSALNTPHGTKLRQLLENEVGATAVWATQRTDSKRSCGYAAGVAYIVSVIETCLPQKPDEAVQLDEIEDILSQ